MIAPPASVRLLLCTEPADMRKGFDGLSAIVASHLGEEPTSGHFFIFRNRRGDRLKILYWDGDGMAIWYKRLERGTFRLPAMPPGPRPTLLELSSTQLVALLEGLDLKSVRKTRRYRLRDPAA